MFFNPNPVISSPISFIFFPLPPWVFFRQFNHQRVPVDLGNIGRGRHAKIVFVCLDRGQNRLKARAQAHRVDDDDITRQAQ